MYAYGRVADNAARSVSIRPKLCNTKPSLPLGISVKYPWAPDASYQAWTMAEPMRAFHMGPMQNLPRLRDGQGMQYQRCLGCCGSNDS